MQGPDDDAPSGSSPDDDAPYTVYGGGGRRAPRRAARDDGARNQPERDDDRAGGGRRDEAPYTVYRAQRRAGRDRSRAGGEPAGPDHDEPAPGDRRERRRRRRRQRSLPRRLVRYGLTFVVGWIVLSLVLFVVSATIHQQTGAADQVLGGGGAPFTPTNVLVLGTDARPPGSKEPGAEGGSGGSRTDTIMLLRTGGFANAKLSIPRDTLVSLPGRPGLQKINAAYAFDGTRGAVNAVESLTGIEVNHVVTIDFENFPGLVDAMGGINYKAKTCLTSDVSGGAARPRSGVTVGKAKHTGGTSFRLKKGKTYRLNGTAALALARVRKNSCDAGQNDLNRAQRQQQILSGMKSRVMSPIGFLRMPLIAWKAPQAVQTDMSGFSLLGVAISQFLPGGGSSAVLKPSGYGQAADGGQGLIVSPSEIERARRKFDK